MRWACAAVAVILGACDGQGADSETPAPGRPSEDLSGPVVEPAPERQAEEPAQQQPQRPAPTQEPARLPPMVPALEQLAAGAAPPEEAVMAKLRDLMETAFKPRYADERTATMARDALLEDPQAFWILEEGLLHEDVEVANLCAFHLGTVGVQASILPLLKRLKYEQDDQNLYWVRHALYRLGNFAGLRKLADTLDASGYDALHSNALRDLSLHWEREGAPFAPGAKGRPPLSGLTEARIAKRLLDFVGKPLRPIDDCRFILGRAGKLSLPMLGIALRGSERYLRTHALEVVATLGPVAKSLRDQVKSLLWDNDSSDWAVRALGRIGIPADWESLGPILDRPVRKASDYELQKEVVLAAARCGASQVVVRAAQILADEAQPVDLKVSAAFAQASFGDDAGVRWLQDLLAAGTYHAPTLRELLDELGAPEQPAEAVDGSPETGR